MLGAAQCFAPHALGLPLVVVWSTFGVLLAVRIYAMTRPAARHNFTMLVIGAVGCNLLWGLCVAGVEMRVGVGLSSVIYAFFLPGIASGSVAALAPSSGLQRIALAVLTLPGAIVALAGYGVPAFGAIHMVLLVYSLVLGTVATREFWSTMVANEQLREAAAAEKRVAEQLREEIAQRLQMEIELRQAQKLEAIGRLAAGIAHEINTPVQFVTDSCTFLADGIRELEAAMTDYHRLIEDLAGLRVPNDQAIARADQLEADHDMAFLRENLGEAAARSLEGLGRVAKIVRATKDFAAHRAEAKAPANLNSAIESTLVICHHETGGVADVEKELGAIPDVLCHGDELNQVFLNLIVNAAHAIADVTNATTERGVIKIKTWAAGEWVKIAISDTGSGISSEILDKIFDPFFTTKPVGKGSGQGLAIARSIVVQKHGGTLDVASQAGVGTTFTIALPAA
jgi:signal transduction histidine kinase